MKQIKGLTEQQIMQVIQKVARNHRNKHFGNYASEDIEQEVYVIIFSRLDKYDETRCTADTAAQSLENWLNTVVSRRLLNLRRDKFLAPQRLSKNLRSDDGVTDYHKQMSVNLMHPLDIFSIDPNSVKISENTVMDNELWQYVLARLNDEQKDILDGLLSGYKMGCYYKNKLKTRIGEIIEEYNNAH